MSTIGIWLFAKCTVVACQLEHFLCGHGVLSYIAEQYLNAISNVDEQEQEEEEE